MYALIGNALFIWFSIGVFKYCDVNIGYKKRTLGDVALRNKVAHISSASIIKRVEPDDKQNDVTKPTKDVQKPPMSRLGKWWYGGSNITDSSNCVTVDSSNCETQDGIYKTVHQFTNYNINLYKFNFICNKDALLEWKQFGYSFLQFIGVSKLIEILTQRFMNYIGFEHLGKFDYNGTRVWTYHVPNTEPVVFF
jgi:hypothetical protein